MDKQKIKELALASGFKLKEQPNGEMDLNSYVYDFVAAIEVQLEEDAWVSADDWEKGCPDDDQPLGPDEFMPLILHWDDGEVEMGHYHYVGMDEPRYQRKCGTDEGGTGWDGGVGHVLNWRRMPKAPNTKQA